MLALSYPHIEKMENQPARLQRLPRVRVAQIVMDYLAHGWSVEEMCRQHPDLTAAEAHAAMAYYYDYQEEIDQEIRQECQQVREKYEPSRTIALLPTNASKRAIVGGYFVVHGCSCSSIDRRSAASPGCKCIRRHWMMMPENFLTIGF